MFDSLLIANRGEIACRIIKTAKKMGIRAIAVYSEADAEALHVTLADDVYPIGSTAITQSYFNPSKIMEAALQTKAAAIHPGYGFLAENAAFAARCQEHHVIFVGPSPEVIATMGNKMAAKQFIKKAGIPVIPGYIGEQQENKTLLREARKLGLPLLIKASLGGGGRGMRQVTEWSELSHALTTAHREAQKFGDSGIVLEKYLSPVRHIEVQIFRDAHGHAMHLFTRDCSIQRRHQKLLEEAPASHLASHFITAMTETAVHIAEMTNYVGVGTVEFLVDADENYYFMEMNTRLQVEHPVTEMITGIDLVEWQLRAAALEALPYQPHLITCQGYALEARICAENPQKQFTPSAGKITRLHWPNPHPQLRIDHGIKEKDNITTEYDSLLAKLITWGKTREEALHLLKKSLEQMVISGIHTNVSWLCRVIKTVDFQFARGNTDFIAQHADELFLSPASLPREMVCIAALIEWAAEEEIRQSHMSLSEDATSPWFWRNHWRWTGPSPSVLFFWYQKQKIELIILPENRHYQFTWEGQTVEASGHWDNEHSFSACIHGAAITALAYRESDHTEIFWQGESYIFYRTDPSVTTLSESTEKNQLRSPMPGVIVAVLVTPGETVVPGQRLAIIEAMKIEYPIIAPVHGIIQSIMHPVGDRIAEGVVLFQLNEPTQPL